MSNELSAEQREYLFYRAGTAGVDALRIIAYLTDVVRLAEQSATRTPVLEQALAQRDEARELADNLATYALPRLNYRDMPENDLKLFHELAERVDALRVASRSERNATQRALDVANADRDALRAMLDVSAERLAIVTSERDDARSTLRRAFGGEP